MPNPLATWNPERDCWETGVVDIFGHTDVYSETWPTAGMARNGVAYTLPTWEPPTSGSASSSSPPGEMLRTPVASEAAGGPLSPERAQAENKTLRLTGQILDIVAPGQMSDAWKSRVAGQMLPTPVAQPSGNTPEDHLRKKPGRTRVTDLAILAENGLFETGGRLLPTPTAQDSAASGGSSKHDVTLTDAVVRTNLGRTPNPRHEPTGAPTPPPSTDGSPSWEDVPLPLPNSPNAESTDSPPASPNG